MKTPDRKYQALEVKWRRALRENKLLREDQNLLLALLERLAANQKADTIKQIDLLNEGIENAADGFELDADATDALAQMAKMTFLGRLFQPNPPPDDPYAFVQLEWLFRESSALSTYATAMLLSLEVLDGRGPQGLDSLTIPPISSAYRCLLVWSEEASRYEDQNVIADSVKLILEKYVPQEKIQEFIRRMIASEPEKSIDWVEPNQLAPGMLVLEDVRNTAGLLLISRYTKMTQQLIDSLLGYDGVQGLTHTIPVQKFSKSHN